MFELLKSNNKTVGLKQSVKAVQDGKVKSIFIATDSDTKIINTVKELCAGSSIEINYVDSMKQLGKACGIDVGASVVCLLKD